MQTFFKPNVCETDTERIQGWFSSTTALRPHQNGQRETRGKEAQKNFGRRALFNYQKVRVSSKKSRRGWGVAAPHLKIYAIRCLVTLFLFLFLTTLFLGCLWVFHFVFFLAGALNKKFREINLMQHEEWRRNGSFWMWRDYSIFYRVSEGAAVTYDKSLKFNG